MKMTPNRRTAARVLALPCLAILCLVPPAALWGEMPESRAEFLSSREAPLERAYLRSIREGIVPPTAVQSMSRAEAAFYGLVSHTESDDAIVRGFASVNPFVMGWNGLSGERDATGRSLDLRSSQRLDLLSLEHPVLLGGLSFAQGGLFATTEIGFTTMGLVKSAEPSGLFGIWSARDYLRWWTFPDQAYVSWAGKHTSLAAGRFKTGIGFGDANLFLNGKANWYDHIEWAWWSSRFRFYSLWGTSSSQLSSEEYACQSANWDTENNHDASTASLTAIKLFTYHYLEYRPLPSLGFGLGEMQIAGGKMPELAHLLPLSYWHNTYSAGSSNVMLLAHAWAVPVPSLLVRGEYVMDDSKSPSESGASKPNCWAWEAGLTWVMPWEPAGLTVTLDVEYSHADKWTYSRWQPYLTMYQRQTLTGGWNGIDSPLGHPEGGDVDAGLLRITARGPSGSRFSVGYGLTIKGPVYLGMISSIDDAGTIRHVPVYYDYDDWTASGELDRLLGGTRKVSHTASLSASVPLGEAWDVEASCDIIYARNRGHVPGNDGFSSVWKAGISRTLLP